MVSLSISSQHVAHHERICTSIGAFSSGADAKARTCPLLQGTHGESSQQGKVCAEIFHVHVADGKYWAFSDPIFKGGVEMGRAPLEDIREQTRQDNFIPPPLPDPPVTISAVLAALAALQLAVKDFATSLTDEDTAPVEVNFPDEVA